MPGKGGTRRRAMSRFVAWSPFTGFAFVKCHRQELLLAALQNADPWHRNRRIYGAMYTPTCRRAFWPGRIRLSAALVLFSATRRPAIADTPAPAASDFRHSPDLMDYFDDSRVTAPRF